MRINKTRVNQLLKLTNPGSFNAGIIPCTSSFSYDVNTLRGWNEMQEYCDHLDDEVCQTLSAIPDGDAFNDFPDDFQSTTNLPF